MVNVVCHHRTDQQEACRGGRRRCILLPKKKKKKNTTIQRGAALRVLGNHLHRDGLHFWVLLQAALAPGRRGRQEVVTTAFVLCKLWQQLWNVVYTHWPPLPLPLPPCRNIAISALIRIYVMLWNLRKWVLKTQSVLVIFIGQETKSYSQFTSVARHLISSKWTLCAQSVEAVYPEEYTKHLSFLHVRSYKTLHQFVRTGSFTAAFGGRLM